MKFVYEYRTSDNVRRSGDICASDRDSAFAALKERGIRPSRLTEAPGVLNYLLGRSRRWLAIGTLAAACAVVGALLATRNEIAVPSVQEADARLAMSSEVVMPSPRKQLGDISGLALESIFAHPTEAYLVRFAQPGVIVDFGDVQDIDTLFEDDLNDALEEAVVFDESDTAQVRDLKRVVVGLKDEAAILLAAGKSYQEILGWFEARQKMEADYRASIIVGGGTMKEKNARLRLIGLRTIPNPKDAE